MRDSIAEIEVTMTALFPLTKAASVLIRLCSHSLEDALVRENIKSREGKIETGLCVKNSISAAIFLAARSSEHITTDGLFTAWDKIDNI